MSTKKTVHTVTAEQKEKLDKHANILAQMETGKNELLKIVGNVPGAEKITELMDRCKKKGKLSATELMDVLEELELIAVARNGEHFRIRLQDNGKKVDLDSSRILAELRKIHTGSDHHD